MQNNTTTLEASVAAFKVIARDALRMNLISPRLSKITELENEIKDTQECEAQNAHFKLVTEYELSVSDKNHPDYEDRKKESEEDIKASEEVTKQHADVVAAIEKEIADQKEGIEKIKSGETKVSLEALNELTEKLIKQDALNQVKS